MQDRNSSVSDYNPLSLSVKSAFSMDFTLFVRFQDGERNFLCTRARGRRFRKRCGGKPYFGGEEILDWGGSPSFHVPSSTDEFDGGPTRGEGRHVRRSLGGGRTGDTHGQTGSIERRDADQADGGPPDGGEPVGGTVGDLRIPAVFRGGAVLPLTMERCCLGDRRLSPSDVPVSREGERRPRGSSPTKRRRRTTWIMGTSITELWVRATDVGRSDSGVEEGGCPASRRVRSEFVLQHFKLRGIRAAQSH